MGLFNFRGAPTKSLSDFTDKELIQYLSQPKDIMNYSRAVKEANKRGLKNPKTGRPYQA